MSWMLLYTFCLAPVDAAARSGLWTRFNWIKERVPVDARSISVLCLCDDKTLRLLGLEFCEIWIPTNKLLGWFVCNRR